MKIIHIITSLDWGGAEIMLAQLLLHQERANGKGHEHLVVSLTGNGVIGKQMQARGVPVRTLNMRRGITAPLAVWRLASLMRAERPQIVQTWMYHADLVGGIAAKLAGGVPVVWGIHNSNLRQGLSKRSTMLVARACAGLSGWLPASIVYCAESSLAVHAGLGYAAVQSRIIPNGFDLEAFQPDPAARLDVRRELGVPPETLLIGLMARFDPQKDHRGFVAAAGQLHALAPDVHFVLCGDGVTESNPELRTWIVAAGVGDRCHLLGPRNDIARIQASLDIASLASSFGEAFPLVIGEAMACGVPCVVTDVGDSALIVGDASQVVPPGDPSALASAWYRLIDIGEDRRSELGLAARRRIEEHFGLEAIAARYAALHEEIATNHSGLRIRPRTQPESRRAASNVEPRHDDASEGRSAASSVRSTIISGLSNGPDYGDKRAAFATTGSETPGESEFAVTKGQHT